MENDKFILSSKNKTKGIRHVINKEIGNFPHNSYNMQLQNNTELITEPRIISEKFNSYFIDKVNDLLNKNSSYKSKQTSTSQQDIKTCLWSMFVSPVTENEVENLINKLKGKLSAEFDEIPEVLVKHCSHYIAKPLTHIFNLSFKFGIFPDLMKKAKISPLF
jgi:hypothetical protein